MNIRQAFGGILRKLGDSRSNGELDYLKLSEMQAAALVAIGDLQQRLERADHTLAKVIKQRDIAEGRAKAAEEDLATRKRIGEGERKRLTELRDENVELRKEIGWIPTAFDSYRRGISRITPELSHMAQLAIMELERQAEDWLKPLNEDDA